MNIFNIENAFTRMREKKWNYLTVAVDYHGTIAGASREPGKLGEIYPNAINVLKQFSDREDIKLVLWTSSHINDIVKVCIQLEKHGITFDAINSNPFNESNTLSDFSKKFYFNILLDDKAGFVGETDWILIENELRRIGEWKEIT